MSVAATLALPETNITADHEGQNDRQGRPQPPARIFPGNRPAFAIEKLDWFDQVRRDRQLTPTTVVVALAIGQHVNSKTREAWPQQETLALETGLSVRTVRDEIRRLIECGHLVKGKKGRGNLNSYRWRIKHASTG